jgi:hypothetical protein
MRACVVGLMALGACATEGPSGDPAAVMVRASLSEETAGGGNLRIQTAYDPTGEIEIPTPDVEGLEFLPLGDAVVESVGHREVVTQTYAFSGAKGSYAVPAMTATWRSADGEFTASTSPLYVDLGVPAPGREGEIFDIANPGRVWTIPWVPVLAIGGVGMLMFGGIFLAFRKDWRSEVGEAPEEPPDRVALRRWEAIREDALLDDFEKAKALSSIFRDYTEAVLGFPASAWTTTEILARLSDLTQLTEGNVPRARRLLRATDRVKYAEQQPGTDFFSDLDSDLRAFISATCPHSWTAP